MYIVFYVSTAPPAQSTAWLGDNKVVAVKEISADAAVVTELDGIFTVKEKQKNATEGSSRRMCFHFTTRS